MNNEEKLQKEVEDLKQKLKNVCSMLLQKEPRYDQWIELNLGKEYLTKD